MKTTRRFAAALFVAAFATGALAALSDAHTQFGNGPAKWLMTREEAAAWKNINNDADAEAFINTFWAKRDPSPGTPANEFRAEFDARVKYADEHFTEGRTKGSMTDRARVFLVMGAPAIVKRTQPATSAMGQPAPSGGIGVPQPGSDSGEQNMIWVYDQAKTKLPLPAPTVQVPFIDQYGHDVWRLDRAPGVDVNAMLQKAAAAQIVNPNATGVATAQVTDTTTTTTTVTKTTTTTTTLTPGAYKTPALKTAVDTLKAAKENQYKNMAFSYGEYITPTGTYFVPVQLALPASAGVTADSNLTFFGEVDDANGVPVAIFEEPAKMLVSKTDVVFDKTLTNLQPGTYRGVFGLADATGKPVSMVTSDMTLKGLDKASSGLSELILSNNIYPMTTPQAPTDPYAFGGMKVVPKSDRTFTPADELWYFFELRNPGVDPGTNLPKIQMKLSLTGKTTAGKDVRMENPLADADTIELKGVPGHYGIGQALPLTSFKPGNYTIKIKVIDLVNKQTYNLEQPFKVVG